MTTISSLAGGRSRPDSVAGLLAVECWLPMAAGRPVATIQTEPHVWPKLLGGAGPSDAEHIDVSPLLDTPRGLLRRRRAITDALAAVERRRLGPGPVVVFDTAEGWLTTNLSLALRRRRPDALQIGLQHGIVPITGFRSAGPIRRARRWTSGVAHRAMGVTPIGAGFGNVGFDGYVLFGTAYARYVARLQARAAILIDFARLQGIEPGLQLDGPADLLFLGQELQGYLGDAADRVTERLVVRLDEIADAGWTVVARPHPKGDPRTWPRPRSAIIDTTPAPFRHLLGPRTIVVSFFSTGLLEAASLGCRIVALSHPSLPPAAYSSLADPIPLKEFLTTWSANRFSSIRPGFIE